MKSSPRRSVPELMSAWLAHERRADVVWVGALTSPLIVCAVCAGLRAQVSSASAALLVVLCVVLSATTRMRLAALASALSGGVWFDFLLVRPYHRFTISDADDVAFTVLLAVIGVLVSEIVVLALEGQEQASKRSGYLEGALSTAEAGVTGDLSQADFVSLVSAQIAGVLDVPSVRYVEGPVSAGRAAVLDHEGVLTRGGRRLDVDRKGLPTDDEVVIDVRRGASVIGHFVIVSASRISTPSLEQRRVAVLLANLVARAVEDPA